MIKSKYAGCPHKKTYPFEINITLKIIKVNSFRKQSFVHLSLMHLFLKIYKATSKIVKSEMN